LTWRNRHPDEFAQESLSRELRSLYARFYGSMLLGFTLIYYLQHYLLYFVFLLFSFWVPQIVLNATNDTSKPFHSSFVIGMTAARVILPLYLLMCPSNVLSTMIDNDVLSALLLLLYMSIQVVILYLQDYCGPRFFVPQRFLPYKYDYHQPMPLFRVNGSEEGDDPCAICYGEFSPNASRYSVMITPCEHVYHTECLTRWMEQKLECPTCRGQLPAV